MYKTGFIDLLEAKAQFNDKTKIEQLKKQISAKIKNYTTKQFEWLIDPKFDFENQSLKFGYRYYAAENDKTRASQIIEYIQFVKDHIIVMKNNYFDDYLDFKPIEFDWTKRITPFEKADINSTYPCRKLSIKDSALSADNFLYLDKQSCFPRMVTELLKQHPGKTEVTGYHELFSFKENNYPIKEVKTTWNR